jgi:hypothetical protein
MRCVMVQASGESGQTGQNRPEPAKSGQTGHTGQPGQTTWPGQHGSERGIACITIFDAEQNNCQDEMRYGAS